jgi:hypothetical protein
MKHKNFVATAVFAVLAMISFAITAAAQTANEANLANVVGGGSGVRWEVNSASAGGTLTITFPDGRSVRKTVKAGGSLQISLGEKYFENPPDGVYFYELQLAASAEKREAAAKSRGKDDDPESERAARKPAGTPSMIQSGSFAIVNGSIVTSGALEPQKQRAKASASNGPTISGDTIRRVRSHHFSLFAVPDVVTADDEIIQGSLCVGLDCVNGENFGFDTIRVKENNTRIQFDDTSTSAGFATNNWQIRANSSASGGASFLAFVDQGATSNSETGTINFEVDAGAPANSIKVASTGKVGFRTATPVLDLHMNTNDTPAVRFEQNNTGGFSAQTWDVAGNEANFFVRDVTSGSRLPFRIRPGAPTSSIDISATGNVGINTASPSTTLDVAGNFLLVGSEAGTSNRTNNTTKLSRVSMPPFATANLNFTLVGGAATSTANIVAVGGEVVGQAAATQVDFVTGGTTNTDTGTVRMTINSSGNVGIGTTSPDQRLSVSGDADKSAGGTSWGVFSDERLKDIKGRYSRGLSAVMGLQPVRFSYKRDNALKLQTDSENIGFSAQALQKLVPEAVTKSSSGYLVVHSDAVLWAMLNAIKEQQAEIGELKAQVRRLTAHSRRHRR